MAPGVLVPLRLLLRVLRVLRVLRALRLLKASREPRFRPGCCCCIPRLSLPVARGKVGAHPAWSGGKLLGSDLRRGG